MIPPDCRNCGRQKELRETVTGAVQYRCPDCEPSWREKSGPGKYLCRGCWKVRACVCHHTSYDPEAVVPMCTDCHERLHQDDDFLPHLSPDMTRGEAEERGLVTKVGLASTDYTAMED